MSDNLYRHSSKKQITQIEREYYTEEYKQFVYDDFKNNRDKKLTSYLLDSSLITPTQYDYKIIECGKYFQIYKFKNQKISYKDKKEKTLLDYDYLFTRLKNFHSKDKKYIQLKNINRSVNQVKRIVKSNEEIFKTFITLTFKDNVTDIDLANKKFDIWRTKIKSIYKEFSYVCVPEFQKRGAVHYHLLTNLEINKLYKYTRRNKKNETKLILPQEQFTDKQLNKMTDEQKKHCYNVKYWSYGFTSIFPLENINVVGYLTKYMTKDMDNRLWGHRKYFYSMNLKRPKEILINSENSIEYSKIFMIEKLYDLQYQKIYYDKCENEIEFYEYKLT